MRCSSTAAQSVCPAAGQARSPTTLNEPPRTESGEQSMEKYSSTFLSRRRRLRRVLQMMIENARQGADGKIASQLTLDELAEQACWSKEHLVRTWTAIYGEPPVATARRIQLDRAASRLIEGNSISKIAEGCGFSSVQAFCRAFRRQFGMSPNELVKSGWAPRSPWATQIVRIREPIVCLGAAYQGSFGSAEEIFDETLDTLAKNGSDPTEWFVFGGWREPPIRSLTDETQVDLHTAVVASKLSAPIRGLSSFVVPAGRYFRFNRAKLYSEEQVEDWLADQGWKRIEGPALQEFGTDPVTTIPSRRRQGLLLPVARKK